MVRIVTDTTASLPPGFAQKHDIAVVPQLLVIGPETLREDHDIDAEGLLRRLASSASLPKTAAPLPSEFVRAYRRQLEHGATVLSIHPSAEVSGTVRSARMAASELHGAAIRILDTRTLAANLGTMVCLAASWAEEGIDAEEILARLHGMIPRSRSFFAVTTLEYLQRGGRIGRASALAGSVLQIKPILELRDGVVQPLERTRTRGRALQRLAELVLAECPPAPDSHLVVMHSGAPAAAAELVDRLHRLDGHAPIPVYQAGAAIALHAGPGTIGAAFFAASGEAPRLNPGWRQA